MSLDKVAHKNILETIGQTPIVKLNHVTGDLQANFYVKCEFMNPGGSVKDRIGINMVLEAEKTGALKPGGTIIEATSGNTGVGLAMCASLRGYSCIFVMADKQSEEKRTALRSMGAKVVICPTNVDPEDPRSYYKVADRLAKETPNSFYASQYYNKSNPEAHYLSTGPEIWEQCGEDLDFFICSIGTGGTVGGVSKFLREQSKDVQIIGVDPIGSIFYDLFHKKKEPKASPYFVEGIGEDFMPGTMDLSCMDDIVQVSDQECFSMARRLIREEGLLIGGSSGAAVCGAMKFVEGRLQWKEKRKPNILVLLPDSSSRYLSKFLNDDWLKDAGFLESEPVKGTVRDLLQTQSLKREKVISVQHTTPLGTVIDLMKLHGISQLPVIKENKVLGLVNEVAVLDGLLNGSLAMNSEVEPIVDSKNTGFVSVSTSIPELAKLLAQGKSAVVLDENYLSGVLTNIDLITHLTHYRRS